MKKYSNTLSYFSLNILSGLFLLSLVQCVTSKSSNINNLPIRNITELIATPSYGTFCMGHLSQINIDSSSAYTKFDTNEKYRTQYKVVHNESRAADLIYNNKEKLLLRKVYDSDEQVFSVFLYTDQINYVCQVDLKKKSKPNKSKKSLFEMLKTQPTNSQHIIFGFPCKEHNVYSLIDTAKIISKVYTTDRIPYLWKEMGPSPKWNLESGLTLKARNFNVDDGESNWGVLSFEQNEEDQNLLDIDTDGFIKVNRAKFTYLLEWHL